MTPEDEVLAVFARWHHEVEQLAVWSGGEARLHDLLRTAVGIRAEQARHGVAVMDFPWESLVDRVAQWHYDHPLGTAEYSPADVHDAVSAAVKFDPRRAAGGWCPQRRVHGAEDRWGIPPEVPLGPGPRQGGVMSG